VVKMKNPTRVELDRKQFGITKGIHSKPKNSALTSDFPAHEATETVKECKIKADQNSAEAITFLRRQLTIR
jgi:hypothetical protein